MNIEGLYRKVKDNILQGQHTENDESHGNVCTVYVHPSGSHLQNVKHFLPVFDQKVVSTLALISIECHTRQRCAHQN